MAKPKPKKKRRSIGVVCNGAEIEKLRKEKGWSQQRLGEEAFIPEEGVEPQLCQRVSTRTVGRAESGYPIKPEYMAAIANALNVPCPDILRSASHSVKPQSFIPSTDDDLISIIVVTGLPGKLKSLQSLQPEDIAVHALHFIKCIGALRDGIADRRADSGSTRITGRVSREDATRIVAAFAEGLLAPILVQSVSVANRPSDLHYIRNAALLAMRDQGESLGRPLLMSLINHRVPPASRSRMLARLLIDLLTVRSYDLETLKAIGSAFAHAVDASIQHSGSRSISDLLINRLPTLSRDIASLLLVFDGFLSDINQHLTSIASKSEHA